MPLGLDLVLGVDHRTCSNVHKCAAITTMALSMGAASTVAGAEIHVSTPTLDDDADPCYTTYAGLVLLFCPGALLCDWLYRGSPT